MSTQVRFINYKTGQSRSASSVSNFCKNHGDSMADRGNFSKLYDGYLHTYKGWVLPEVYWFITEKYDWIDIYGYKYKMSILDVMKAIGMKRFSPRVVKLLKGRAFNIGGLYMGKKLPFKIVKPRSIYVKSYCFVKNGKYYKGSTITGLAKRLEISVQSLRNLVHGRCTKVADVVLHSVSTEEKNIFDDFEKVAKYRLSTK